MEFKKVYEELNILLPFNPNVKVQQAQREQMAVMSFLTSLHSEYETAKSQILSSSEISSLHDTFTRVLRTESTQLPQTTSGALVSQNMNGQQRNKGGNSSNRSNQHNGETNSNLDSKGVICYYCHEPDHTKYNCLKLQRKNQRSQMANMAIDESTVAPSSGKTVLISVEEYAQFFQYQASLKASNSPVTAIAESGSYDKADYW
ncbi:uncharacterized protein LOC110661992 [Hevea brasiliensis]|uniref:uncharacterized protein LOC110661992 n=1 Tax=Hevea brasiliensis TaxID=3981 RepID=UPI0025D41666|nr:uncharacterized protein LOC110661992 [Hevea brasiliensis]